ncbi:hypothetical protein SSX86_009666 [Deinandra increscens subsp. villosa]|uniref:Rhodopsin n=1 Tax=Deinandra increscens subsp. villosa TaxID=3103831 RepID=A0AAP0H1A3_9ASTR
MSQTNQSQPPIAPPPPQGYPEEGQAKGIHPPPDVYAGSGGFPPQIYPTPGYPPQGYPPQGYPPQGYPPGYPPQGYPSYGYPPQGYPPHGYPYQGYPPQPQYNIHYGPPQHHKHDNGFMEGCLAMLCCCCLLDVCF